MAPLVAIMTRGKVEDVALAVAKAEELGKRHNVFLQVVDPAVVYNERHLQSAWLHAERAWQRGSTTAKSIQGEFLMYLTGTRQVSDALVLAGVKPGLERVVVCASGERAGTAVWGVLDKLGWSRDPAGIPINPSAAKVLGAKEGGAATLEEAVLERVALVDLTK